MALPWLARFLHKVAAKLDRKEPRAPPEPASDDGDSEFDEAWDGKSSPAKPQAPSNPWKVLLGRIVHLFFATLWFLVFAAVAAGLDKLAQWVHQHCGLDPSTQRPLEWGAHLLMYADLAGLTVVLVESVLLLVVKAYQGLQEA